MSANNDTRTDDSEVTIAKYNGNADGDYRPAVFAEHRTGRCESSVVFGEGAEAEVRVVGGELTLTLTVDSFDDPAHLLDRDLLAVEVTGKDL